jgi:hypothetical protein
MKRVLAIALLALMLVPGVAFAGSSTDAALGLGAFAALGTLLLGAAMFGGQAAVAAPAPPAIYAPPPAVYESPAVYAPPPAVYAPPPVVYRPAPPAVVYGPRAVYSPAPVYGHRHGSYVRHDQAPYVRRGYWQNGYWQR